MSKILKAAVCAFIYCVQFSAAAHAQTYEFKDAEINAGYTEFVPEDCFFNCADQYLFLDMRDFATPYDAYLEAFGNASMVHETAVGGELVSEFSGSHVDVFVRHDGEFIEEIALFASDSAVVNPKLRKLIRLPLIHSPDHWTLYAFKLSNCMSDDDHVYRAPYTVVGPCYLGRPSNYNNFWLIFETEKEDIDCLNLSQDRMLFEQICGSNDPPIAIGYFVTRGAVFEASLSGIDITFEYISCRFHKICSFGF